MPDCLTCSREPEWQCLECGKDLHEYNPDFPAIAPHIAYNSLYVRLEGGYGMFFDTDFHTHPDIYGFFLCHDCAHKLCDIMPSIGKLMENGHIEEGEVGNGC